MFPFCSISFIPKKKILAEICYYMKFDEILRKYILYFIFSFNEDHCPGWTNQSVFLWVYVTVLFSVLFGKSRPLARFVFFFVI